MPSTAPQVERVELDELVCWRIRTAQAELLVAQQGAQVLRYQPHGQQPIIWLSEQAAYKKGQSVRGGVPVCWPWFGDLARNPETIQQLHAGGAAPAHGPVRGLDWQLQGIDQDDEGVNLRFSFPTSALATLPKGVELSFDVRLDQRLSLSLTTRNAGSQPLVLSQALHTYFAVADIHQTRIEGLEQTRYIETLEDWQQRQQQGAVTFTGETDRIYLDVPAALSIVDPLWQRRIHLASSGSHSAVVWNPWIAKAQRLSQFADDAWPGMLCIETANVMDDIVSLAPGEQHSMAVTLWAEPL
ncbi:D-hexose-6-phosphate mutarotase [Pseudomonas sp. GV071]|jgi:glucose-6-phosphate 1-epimerase|uniref:D-hexose-6-phosphate mutarotase n=1 Tax=Pseudomonas sp. GV071 TaxID=2135754 RepID=UPI000D348FEC|nr:D-hexose-6-phosphate mutarotase [Pseudomonas sp. GV071]PTQ73098.1 glucose-6-phosphate 1-epimerase [Pseudomonas sp. GV071]